MSESLRNFAQKDKVLNKSQLLKYFPKLIQTQWEKRGGDNYVKDIIPAYEQMYEDLVKIILLEKPNTILEFGCGYGYC